MKALAFLSPLLISSFLNHNRFNLHDLRDKVWPRLSGLRAASCTAVITARQGRAKGADQGAQIKDENMTEGTSARSCLSLMWSVWVRCYKNRSCLSPTQETHFVVFLYIEWKQFPSTAFPAGHIFGYSHPGRELLLFLLLNFYELSHTQIFSLHTIMTVPFPVPHPAFKANLTNQMDTASHCWIKCVLP